MNMINYRQQRGASMVEIVVTIVIVAIALLGLASMQANAMTYLKIANLRSEAVQAAYDISDRMRANGAAIKSGGVNPNFYSYTASYASKGGSMPTVPTCATAGQCTAQEIANIDLAEWQRGLSSRLISGGGYVVPNAVNGYDVTVMWKELSLTTTDAGCPTAGVTAPGVGVRCFTVRFTP